MKGINKQLINTEQAIEMFQYYMDNVLYREGQSPIVSHVEIVQGDASNNWQSFFSLVLINQQEQFKRDLKGS